MFTLGALSTLVAGEKVIPFIERKWFSQDVFVVLLTIPITMFYYNHFLRESALKKSTRYQIFTSTWATIPVFCLATLF
jgi:hypothetical protein